MAPTWTGPGLFEKEYGKCLIRTLKFEKYVLIKQFSNLFAERSTLFSTLEDMKFQCVRRQNILFSIFRKRLKSFSAAKLKLTEDLKMCVLW